MSLLTAASITAASLDNDEFDVCDGYLIQRYTKTFNGAGSFRLRPQIARKRGRFHLESCFVFDWLEYVHDSAAKSGCADATAIISGKREAI